jgi:hypothetical protein
MRENAKKNINEKRQQQPDIKQSINVKRRRFKVTVSSPPHFFFCVQHKKRNFLPMLGWADGWKGVLKLWRFYGLN